MKSIEQRLEDYGRRMSLDIPLLLRKELDLSSLKPGELKVIITALDDVCRALGRQDSDRLSHIKIHGYGIKEFIEKYGEARAFYQDRMSAA